MLVYLFAVSNLVFSVHASIYVQAPEHVPKLYLETLIRKFAQPLKDIQELTGDGVQLELSIRSPEKGKNSSDKEKELSEKESSDREHSDKDHSDKDLSDKELSDKKDAKDSADSDYMMAEQSITTKKFKKVPEHEEQETHKRIEHKKKGKRFTTASEQSIQSNKNRNTRRDTVNRQNRHNSINRKLNKKKLRGRQHLMTTEQQIPETHTEPAYHQRVEEEQSLPSHQPLHSAPSPLTDEPPPPPQRQHHGNQRPHQVEQVPPQVPQLPQQVPQLPQQVPQLPQQVPQLPQHVAQIPQQVPPLPEQVQHLPQQVQPSPSPPQPPPVLALNQHQLQQAMYLLNSIHAQSPSPQVQQNLQPISLQNLQHMHIPIIQSLLPASPPNVPGLQYTGVLPQSTLNLQSLGITLSSMQPMPMQQTTVQPNPPQPLNTQNQVEANVEKQTDSTAAANQQSQSDSKKVVEIADITKAFEELQERLENRRNKTETELLDSRIAINEELNKTLDSFEKKLLSFLGIHETDMRRSMNNASKEAIDHSEDDKESSRRCSDKNLMHEAMQPLLFEDLWKYLGKRKCEEDYELEKGLAKGLEKSPRLRAVPPNSLKSRKLKRRSFYLQPPSEEAHNNSALFRNIVIQTDTGKIKIPLADVISKLVN